MMTVSEKYIFTGSCDPDQQAVSAAVLPETTCFFISYPTEPSRRLHAAQTADNKSSRTVKRTKSRSEITAAAGHLSYNDECGKVRAYAFRSCIRSVHICHDPVMFFMQIRIVAERACFDIAGIKAGTA